MYYSVIRKRIHLIVSTFCDSAKYLKIHLLLAITITDFDTFQLPLPSSHLCWPHHLPRANPNQRDPANAFLGLGPLLCYPPRQSRPPRSLPLISLLHLPLPHLYHRRFGRLCRKPAQQSCWRRRSRLSLPLLPRLQPRPQRQQRALCHRNPNF